MNWLKIKLLASMVSLLQGLLLMGQVIPKDTSYTAQSTLLKFQKQYPGISVAVSGKTDLVRISEDRIYKSIGERDLYVAIFTPVKDKNQEYPGVLMIHGGGWRTGDKSLMIPMAEAIAAAGYVAVAVEYRLSLEATYPAAIHDLKAAIRWMRTNAGALSVDPKRIAVLGCSAGGQLAALLGTTGDDPKFDSEPNEKVSSTFQAIVNLDGILAFQHPESEEGDMAAQWLGGTYSEVPEAWENASALNHVSKLTPPTLFLASAYPRFLAGRQDFVDRLNSYGIKNRTEYFKDAPHAFWLFNPWFEPTVNYVTRFLDEVLKK